MQFRQIGSGCSRRSVSDRQAVIRKMIATWGRGGAGENESRICGSKSSEWMYTEPYREPQNGNPGLQVVRRVERSGTTVRGVNPVDSHERPNDEQGHGNPADHGGESSRA